ncbi:ATP-binding protein [Micromonospora sp. WMMD1102]|uniref:ATP-binding protein n=1 Tax=Micromonospora sp. WMMD1102 TaxID=3016105 RepID=UPI002414EC11|nr:ATP-binding protein [Micromonospora sp. WMMD1102]MDG4790875.1 ATP-binding protein [Micromonospora sp. WMMD1102]
MDPVRNPYAPGAGQRPPELAGRDRELEVFDIVLERIARGRPERSLVLTGLRGVGKTVLLNTLRSQAITRLWGTGKIEARPDQSIRRPVAAALHMAIRELAPRHRAPDRIDDFLGVLKAFALRSAPTGAGRGAGATRLRDRWQPGIDVPAASGRADSGDIEIDLVELFTDAAEVAADVGTGVAVFLDEMQDLGPEDVSGLCAACHELSQLGAPLIVVGAGLPHLPAVLSAAKSYSERLFRYQRIDRLDRIAADQALCAPAAREQVEYEPKALDLLYEKSGGYPYFVQAYGKATWDSAPRSPVTAADVRVAAPEAETELAVGFFGSRFERATPAEREYMRAMATLSLVEAPEGADGTGGDSTDDGTGGGTGGGSGLRDDMDAAVSTAEIARSLGRKPASLSPARDALIKKGLIYSGERGTVAFTVPHFGRYLRTQPA